MKRKYSNKYANKKQQGKESPVVLVCGNGETHRRISRLIAAAMSVSAICGHISGDGERKDNQ